MDDTATTSSTDSVHQEVMKGTMGGGSGDLMKEQEDLLQCPICIDRLENPKDLLCNHTFCKVCSNAHKKSAKNIQKFFFLNKSHTGFKIS